MAVFVVFCAGGAVFWGVVLAAFRFRNGGTPRSKGRNVGARHTSYNRAGQLSAQAGVEHPLERILVAVANNQSEREGGVRKNLSTSQLPTKAEELAFILSMVEDWSVEKVSASTAIERGSVGFESTDNVQ